MHSETDMISVDEARDRILAFFDRLPAERKPLLDALGQVLAEDIVAPFDIPPLDNTAMDGYAVRAADTAGASDSSPVELRVVADLAAGYVHETPIGPGEAVRIMTGAPMRSFRSRRPMSPFAGPTRPRGRARRCT